MSPAAIALLIKIAVAAAAVSAAVAGYQWWEGVQEAEGEKRGRAALQAEWDADTKKSQAAALEAARQAAAETLRRLNKQQENQLAQDRLLAQARRDADRAVAAADSLRLRADTYLAAAGCAGSGDSATECIRQAAARIGDALGQCGSIARRVAADADDARARGLKCEADYDALTKP